MVVKTCLEGCGHCEDVLMAICGFTCNTRLLQTGVLRDSWFDSLLGMAYRLFLCLFPIMLLQFEPRYLHHLPRMSDDNSPIIKRKLIVLKITNAMYRSTGALSLTCHNEALSTLSPLLCKPLDLFYLANHLISFTIPATWSLLPFQPLHPLYHASYLIPFTQPPTSPLLSCQSLAPFYPASHLIPFIWPVILSHLHCQPLDPIYPANHLIYFGRVKCDQVISMVKGINQLTTFTLQAH